jgi:hypothetical protein
VLQIVSTTINRNTKQLILARPFVNEVLHASRPLQFHLAPLGKSVPRLNGQQQVTTKYNSSGRDGKYNYAYIA